MTDDVIGLNPARAKQQIEELNGNLTSIQNTFVANTQDYLSNLKDLWYSPKAVEFSQDIIVTLNEVDDELKKLTTDIIDDACGAFNILASAHGTSRISVFPGPFSSSQYQNCKEIDPSGNVGMRIKDVNILTTDYIAQLGNLNNSLQNVPKNISFYDTEGNLAGLFSTKVDKVKSLINDSINYINQKLAQSINEQIELSEQGVSNAADLLSNIK